MKLISYLVKYKMKSSLKNNISVRVLKKSKNGFSYESYLKDIFILIEDSWLVIKSNILEMTKDNSISDIKQEVYKFIDNIFKKFIGYDVFIEIDINNKLDFEDFKIDIIKNIENNWLETKSNILKVTNKKDIDNINDEIFKFVQNISHRIMKEIEL